MPAMSVDREVLRILDVNFNRAREALRVIEDYARFIRDDRDAAVAAKTLRHGLREMLARMGVEPSLAARDIESDIGCDARTTSEFLRADAAAVAAAAFGRLTEAARSLAEYGKLVHPQISLFAERLRYDAYELEQRTLLRAGRRAALRTCRLYVIITESLCRRPWLETAEAALRGGATCIQLREKPADSAQLMPPGQSPHFANRDPSVPQPASVASGRCSDRDLLNRARALRELTHRYNALLIVNDRPDIARLAAADGVHVGQDDLSVHDVRRIAGADLLVGKSTHSLEQFDSALLENPDYVAVGPIFPSATKPQSRIAGLETLAVAERKSELPLVAVGGIDPSNVARVRCTGAACVCVCSSVIGAGDPEAAARSLLSS